MNILKNKSSSIKDLLALVTLAVLIIVGLLIGPGSFGTLVAATDSGDEEVTICKATSSGNNPFVKQTPSKSSIIGDTGHGSSGINADDIIPAFDDYPGQNLGYYEIYDMTGLQILDNNCDVNITPPEPQFVTIIATKIVCPEASMLPQSTETYQVDKNTASAFLDGNDDCYPMAGWEFQWSFEDPAGIPDNAGESSDWNTSEPTDSDGQTTITVSEEGLGTNENISLREVWSNEYIGFAGVDGSGDSAEFYCETDGNELDNFEQIFNATLGETYHCVAWNVPAEEEEVITDPDPEYATIIAHKIVCTDEDEMPKYGEGGPNMDHQTASDWVANNKSCDFGYDWEFEWAPQGTPNPGDELYGPAGGDWITFGPTGCGGEVTLNLTASDIDGINNIWIREVLQEGYIPFTFGPNGGNNNDDHSAEMYCHTDVLNYDNYERIDGIEVNNTYYCVAWNMKIDDNGYDNGNGNGNGEENGNGNGEGENGNGDDPDNGDGDDDSGSQTPSTTSSGGGSGALVYAGETTEPTPEGLVAGIEDTTESSESSTVDQPEGQVAGEEVSIMPLGAPDTGMGGTSPGSNNGAWPVTLAIMMILTTAFINLKSLFA